MSRNRPRVVSLLAAIASAAIVITFAPAAATGESVSAGPRPEVRATLSRGSMTVDGEGVAPRVPASELADIEMFARDRGVKPESLTQHSVPAAVVDSMMAKIGAEYGSTLASHGWHVTPAKSGAQYWILFTAKPDEGLVTYLETLPLIVEVRYGAPASEREQEKVVGAMLNSLMRHEGVFTGIEGGFSGDLHDQVEIKYALEPSSSLAPGSLDAMFTEALWAAAGTTADGAVPAPVQFLETLGRSTVAADIKGGYGLFQDDNPENYCTGGFTARRNNNGVYGIITAQHCPSNLQYRDVVGAIVFGVNATMTPEGNYIDLQFHRKTDGHSTSPVVRDDIGSERTIQSYGNPGAGAIVCHFGQTTGSGCAVVVNPNRCLVSYWPIEVELRNSCGLFSVDERNFAPGDSGGPAFFGTAARGVIEAFTTTADFYTRIGAVANNLDATVLTQ